MSKQASFLTDTVFPGAGSGAKATGDAIVAAVTPDIPQPPEVANPALLPLPPADPANTDAQAERDAAAEEARKRSAYGRSSTNPTGGLGDLSTPNLAAKSLLGL